MTEFYAFFSGTFLSYSFLNIGLAVCLTVLLIGVFPRMSALSRSRGGILTSIWFNILITLVVAFTPYLNLGAAAVYGILIAMITIASYNAKGKRMINELEAAAYFVLHR